MKNKHSIKWVTQRITAIILIPISFWFIFKCISFQNLDYYELKLFFESYLNSVLFLIMMLAMLIHAKLGCETIIEDYVSTKSLKKISITLINFIVITSFFLVILAIFKLNAL